MKIENGMVVFENLEASTPVVGVSACVKAQADPGKTLDELAKVALMGEAAVENCNRMFSRREMTTY